MRKPSKINNLIRNKMFIIAIISIVVIGTGAGLYWNHHRSKNAASQPAPTTEQAQEATQTNVSPTQQGKGSGTAAAASAGNAQAAQTTETLQKPVGQVLNKSVVHLSESNAASQYGSGMDSTCETIEGATCGVKLTSAAGRVVTIPGVAAKASGATYFADIPWDAKQAGLTAGSWKVQLLAAKGNQTGLSDAYTLEVQ